MTDATNGDVPEHLYNWLLADLSATTASTSTIIIVEIKVIYIYSSSACWLSN